MAPKKNSKITSSSTRSARIKGGSNPVVTKGEARTRAARTTLGPAPKQRPMASGGTKGPLQGGTRSPGLKMNASKMEAGPAKVGPNLGQQSTASSAGPKAARPLAESRIRSLEAKPAKVGPNMGQQSTSSSAGPRSVRPPSESSIRRMEAGPGKVRAGMGGGTTLSSKPGANAARAQAGKDAARMANRVAKGYGQSAAKTLAAGARTVLGRAAVVGGIASGLNDNLNPNSAMNKRDAELLRRINKPSKYGPRFKNAGTGASAAKGAKPAASTSRFAGARDKAMAKAKAIKGSPVLGPKKVGTGKVGTIAQAFDKSFASARKASKSGFTFKGKKYTTKMA